MADDLDRLMDMANRDTLQRIAKRQRFLQLRAPRCQFCAHDQVQLVHATKPPAEWRCRICKTRFTYEPQGDPT